uniref:Light harvesting protein n=1 Tax=Haptolina brevifila TaxID=156173 RepID=A0A7S2HK70_9EUKA|mmetsp:Transcript_55510/g.110260  ORF Transcript_55510/g.110260 Transcript_55510/m.110260 type:complete len:266 (+) Transcript_55510:34-831(+)
MAMAMLTQSAMGFAPAMTAGNSAAARASVKMETISDLKVLATNLNPVVGFWDPLKLAEAEFWDNSNEETIGWLRHAEIKHGRVAMAGFVGYLVHANGIHFPWHTPGDELCGSVSAPELWHSLPEVAKVQIVLAIGFLEWWSELRLIPGEAHYMKGGKPGYFPSFDLFRETVHPLPLNLWDPLGFTSKMTPERKEKALLAEINNGRLAMIGIIGFVSASKGLIVPGMDGLGLPIYDGEVMAPFSATDAAALPFVSTMLEKVGTFGY